MAGLAHDAAHFFKFLFILVLFTLVMTLFVRVLFIDTCLAAHGSTHRTSSSPRSSATGVSRSLSRLSSPYTK